MNDLVVAPSPLTWGMWSKRAPSKDLAKTRSIKQVFDLALTGWGGGGYIPNVCKVQLAYTDRGGGGTGVCEGDLTQMPKTTGT